jgi:hypothetical protein
MSEQEKLRKLIANNNRRLQILKERKALLGVSTDPGVLIEIEDIEAEIEDLQRQLNQKIPKLLFLTSNPKDTIRLDIGSEIRVVIGQIILLRTGQKLDRLNGLPVKVIS